MTATSKLEKTLADLRRDFDLSFAQPPAQGLVEAVDLVVVRVKGVSYGVRVSAISGIEAKRRLTRVPSQAPHLLGVTGIRGIVVPVFSLASLLGHGATAEGSPWLLLCGRAEPIALAASEFDGHLRIPALQLSSPDGPADGDLAREVATTDAGALPVLDVAGLLAVLGIHEVLVPEKEQ